MYSSTKPPPRIPCYLCSSDSYLTIDNLLFHYSPPIPYSAFVLSYLPMTKATMAETSLFGKCPSTIEEWTDAASNNGLLAVSPKDYTDHKHGSKITQPQFIVLRTLVQSAGPESFDPTLFDLETDIEIARPLLQGREDFKSYIDAIRANSCRAKDWFSSPRRMHCEILEAHARPVQPRDEELDKPPVRYSANDLLMAICSISPNVESREWCNSSRIDLMAKFGSGKGRGFIASTSGQIQDKSRSLWIKAPVNCTTNERHIYGSVIDMQEAALLVAWMKEYPGYPGPKRYVVLSFQTARQDGIKMLTMTDESLSLRMESKFT